MKNSPYGTKSPQRVKEIAMENVGYLYDLGCKIVVVACNTATSVAINDLRDLYRDIDIIGTEPAVKVAIDANLERKILVLGTTITTNQERMRNLIKELNATSYVHLLPADKLVQYIENEDFMNIQNEINEYIKELLIPYNMLDYSHIVLGCTHFPIVKDNIENVLKSEYGNIDIKIIDSAEGVSRNLLRRVENNSRKQIHVIMTAHSKAFEKRIKEVMGNEQLDIWVGEQRRGL